ncbi:hypothetical protein [Clavibacter michiganensis]|uniref:hypothetical protein n=1 Tax=Clavibacter michiganensis TaxID=28447 RepID=UPI00117FFBD8|nr:hypothetical protein [Clavibacter michiganensis]MDO4099013.1 hypothetical protein [Clavibacter michiganensis]MDO4127638.1 hypothetical protein [Clavibacter michiganensis]NIY61565.1 hypothetical protein [Clavibacter michiganensis subsp. michiganensis]QXP02571.1 hypothetical protein KN218_13540 [Clavibacter michiganensis subsp. michiganensis]QXP05596.1 hypothetical protein KN200_13615 [Clavibacter michiganensis subsp. michiganensis]
MSLAESKQRPTATGAANYGVPFYGNPQGANETLAFSLRVDYLRSNVDVLGGEVYDLHGEARGHDLQQRILEKSKKSTSGLLEELYVERAMGWSDIADVAGVSVSAVRKWRAGGAASAENRNALAHIAAFLDVLEEKGLVQEPAQWMEVDLPLPAGWLIRPIDLYKEGAIVPLLDLVEQRKSINEVLDAARPEWREQRSAFAVREDVDGQRTLSLRSE